MPLMKLFLQKSKLDFPIFKLKYVYIKASVLVRTIKAVFLLNSFLVFITYTIEGIWSM